MEFKYLKQTNCAVMYFYYSDFHHPATKLQLNMKETPYFSFRQADIVASHVNKTKNIVGDNDNEVIHLLKLKISISTLS